MVKGKWENWLRFPPYPGEKHEGRVYLALKIWRKEQKLSWDSQLIKHNDVIVAAVVVIVIMPVKQKCHQMVLLSLVLFMTQVKNGLIALRIWYSHWSTLGWRRSVNAWDTFLATDHTIPNLGELANSHLHGHHPPWRASCSAFPHENMNVCSMPSSHMLPLK